MRFALLRRALAHPERLSPIQYLALLLGMLAVTWGSCWLLISALHIGFVLLVGAVWAGAPG
jgi:hypothetical protein